MEFKMTPIALFLLTLISMTPITVSKPYKANGKEDVHDVMQVDEGYRNDDSTTHGDFQPAQSCGGKPVDVYFLVDSSEKVNKNDFLGSLKRLSDLVTAFDPTLTRIGVLTFGRTVRMVSNLNSYKAQELQSKIEGISRTDDQPNVARALWFLRRFAFSPRRVRPDAVKMAFVITNGFSSDSTAVSLRAEQLQNAGVNVFSIYPSDEADADQVTSIASQPTYSRLFSVSDSYYNMVYFIQEILGSTSCDTQLQGTESEIVDEAWNYWDMI